MKLIITNLPAFYKIRLFNEINKRSKLKVIFTGSDSDTRNSDFYHGTIEFDYEFLNGSFIAKLLSLIKILRGPWGEIIIGGWDNLYYWITIILSSKIHNSLIVESSVYESTVNGFAGFLKRFFLTRISKVYCCGKPHERLVRKLGFKDRVNITKSVGVFNYHAQPPFFAREVVKNFLYVGRLVEVKNLMYLILHFNKHPEYNLHIVGFGHQEEDLRAVASDNIIFHGAVNNIELSRYYQTLDVFVLPSLSEPWGLVVEEALNNGMPVLVSDRVGCHEDLVSPNTGLVFSLQKGDFEDKLKEMCNIHNYNKMRYYISTLDFEKNESEQIASYI